MEYLSIKKVANGIVKILRVLTTIIILFGLMLAASLKIEKVASKTLSLYPRYSLALEGIEVLKNDPQFIKKDDEIIKSEDSDQGVMTTALCIDHPSWPVMLDFINSEIAFLKSDRNQAIEGVLGTENQSDDNEDATNKKMLTEINYDRIKSIFVIRVTGVLKVGNKPITATHRTQVFDESQKANLMVYDFLSFEEFKFDIRKMLVNELELFSILLAIIAVLCNIGLYCIRKYFKAYLNS